MLIKLITTHFLLRFEYEFVDDATSSMASEPVRKDVPLAEPNSLHLPGLRKGESSFLRYKCMGQK